MSDLYRTLQVDDRIVVIASERADIEAALVEVRAAGITVLSEIAAMGREFAFTVRDPASRCDEVSEQQIGLRRLIKGPTEHAVARVLGERVRHGSRLVSAPVLSEGMWIGVCDDAQQVRYW